jgi:uncharacterized protein YyaL (SSP411 family)
MQVMAPPLAWHAWNAGAFAQAAEQNRPVFAHLFVTWSRACQHLEREVLSHPVVTARLAEHFVCVREDADLRPDVALRYGLGGWPTLLVLTPDGDRLTGGRAPDPGPLAEQLDRIAAAFRDGRYAPPPRSATPVPDGGRPPRGAGGNIPASLASDFVASAADHLDRERASFGTWAGDAAVVRALLALDARDHPRAPELARACMEITREGLSDAATGPILRPGSGTAGSVVERVVLLEDLAAVLEAMVAAAGRFEHQDFREDARGLVEFVRQHLRHPGGGLSHAWGPAALDDRARATADEPGSGAVLDPRRFVDANAAAAVALLRAGDLVGDTSLAEWAVDIVERVVASSYERSAGVAHVLDPEIRVRGLLGDQVEAARALLGVADVSGMRVYLDVSEELMRGVLARHWDDEASALRDRHPAAEAGLPDGAEFPVRTNARAAAVLIQLGRRVGDAALAERAETILGSIAPLVPVVGPDAADLVLASQGA